MEAPASASVKASTLIRNVVILGLVGLASGILVWLVISFVWESLIGLDAYAEIAGWGLSFGHLTLVPGLVFGNAVALALMRFGLANPGRALAYIAASTVSNFIATNFAANMVDAIDSAVFLGMAAGLIGAACLTGLTLLLFPFARQIGPCLWMVAAGTALGALLHVAIEDSSSWGRGFLLLYGCWQAGYGAALGTALLRRSPA
ncbi:MAG: hypothetical protein ACKVOI_02560 [Dongiaceae bacterium]